LTDATDRYRSVSIRRICLIRGSFCLNVQIENDLDVDYASLQSYGYGMCAVVRAEF
jgi:hypothetical protein